MNSSPSLKQITQHIMKTLQANNNLLKINMIKDIVSFVLDREMMHSSGQKIGNIEEFDIAQMVYRWWSNFCSKFIQHKYDEEWVMQHIIYNMLHLNYLRQYYSEDTFCLDYPSQYSEYFDDEE